jgi:hypothetical protein
MSLKINVAIALFLSIVLFGSIVIFGLVNNLFFAVTYFFFILFVIIIAIFSIKHLFDKKSTLILALILAIFVSFSVTYLAVETKDYSNKNIEFTKNSQGLISQINDITGINEQYLNQVSYMSDQIKTIKSNSARIQSEINSLNSKKDSQLINTSQVVKNNTLRERDEREEDD